MCACGSSDPLTCPSARLRRVWLTRATKASLAPQRLWECSATGVRSAEGPTSAAAPWGGISAGARPSRFSPKRSRQCSLRHVTASACVGPARRRQPLNPREGEPSLRPSSPGFAIAWAPLASSPCTQRHRDPPAAGSGSPSTCRRASVEARCRRWRPAFAQRTQRERP